ncbi:hypothetical protein P2A10_07285 [Xanthomonas perforans]|nr:hypothetical protein [Xanthomonas perforans]
MTQIVRGILVMPVIISQEDPQRSPPCWMTRIRYGKVRTQLTRRRQHLAFKKKLS